MGSVHRVGMFLFGLAVLLVLGWLFSGKSEPKGDACAPQLEGHGGVRISVCDARDNRTTQQRINDETDKHVKEWRLKDWIVKQYNELTMSRAVGRQKANETIASDLRKQGLNVQMEAETRAQSKIAQARAERDRVELEEQKALQERYANEESDRKAFKQVEIEDSKVGSRLEAGLKELRRQLEAAGGLLEVGEDARGSLQDAKTAVMTELNRLLAAVEKWSHLKAWLNREGKGFDGAQLRAEVAKNWERYLSACRDAPQWCYVKFIKAEDGLGLDGAIARVRQAIKEFRFHNAADLVETITDLALDRTKGVPPVPAKRAGIRLPTFCAQVGRQGFLAVHDSAMPHATLGAVKRFDANDMYAPNARHCVWVWQHGSFDGWTLVCGNREHAYTQPSGNFVRGDVVAPDPNKRQTPDHINPTLPLPATEAVLEGCRKAREALGGEDRKVEREAPSGWVDPNVRPVRNPVCPFNYPKVLAQDQPGCRCSPRPGQGHWFCHGGPRS